MARKTSNWAKSAGEFYRKNKGKNGIESFSDVLKSAAFKKEYHAKYGKTKKHGGEDLQELPIIGGGKRRTLKKGGAGEDLSADANPDALSIDAVDAVPAKTPEPVSGGDMESTLPETAPISDSAVMTGGKKKGKKSAKKRGGKSRKTAKKSCFKLW